MYIAICYIETTPNRDYLYINLVPYFGLPFAFKGYFEVLKLALEKLAMITIFHTLKMSHACISW